VVAVRPAITAALLLARLNKDALTTTTIAPGVVHASSTRLLDLVRRSSVAVLDASGIPPGRSHGRATRLVHQSPLALRY
jgi:hypothetical protein